MILQRGPGPRMAPAAAPVSGRETPGRRIAGMEWTGVTAYDQKKTVLKVGDVGVARLSQQAGGSGAWVVHLWYHRSDEQRVLRKCSSFDQGRAGAEIWAGRTWKRCWPRPRQSGPLGGCCPRLTRTVPLSTGRCSPAANRRILAGHAGSEARASGDRGYIWGYRGIHFRAKPRSEAFQAGQVGRRHLHQQWVLRTVKGRRTALWCGLRPFYLYRLSVNLVALRKTVGDVAATRVVSLDFLEHRA
jgi:hypothetical protein